MRAVTQSAAINARYRADCTAYYGQASIEVFTLLAAATLRSEVFSGVPQIEKSAGLLTTKGNDMDCSHHEAAAPTASKSTGATNAGYTCPMHPEIHSPQPGNCPKCGMVLVPVA